eukprot:GHVH01015099.1.p1 GENE.GHVH01015099.1~~GHVH01015099.1.p1  ORF type:complete len:307 (+),score=29.41 GHVH01015099.1:1399-2319(+)
MVEPPITDEDVGDLAGRVVVDRYELVHVVGSGSSSTVYSAIDRRYKKNVALKIGSDSKESLDQLVYELQMIHLIDQSDVTSSHHTRVIDSFYWRSRMVIVMPLYGMDLYQRLLRSETLGSKDMFTRLATQILSCLCELHNCGIIHSDIKPENIVEGFHRAEKCNYYLIDFGMARLTSDIVSYYIQTRSYRAPELLLQLPYDTKIDVWALGCVLAEIWTGRPLFQSVDELAALQQIIDTCGPPPPYMLQRGRDDMQSLDISASSYTLWTRLNMDDEMFDFVSQFLKYDPCVRWSARQLLDHPFIRNS